MSETPRLEETVRRTLQANVQLCESLAQVSVNYVKSLVDIWSGLGFPFRFGPVTPSATAAAPAPPAAPTRAAASPALVLTGEAGHEARGVFMVANQLGRQVSAPVVATSFADPSGREARPSFRLEPEVVTLDAGGQALVQIVVEVDETLDPGVDYRAEISVPGLSDSRVPLLLRRRAAAPIPQATAPAPKKPHSSRKG